VALYPNPTADNTTLIIDNYNVESINVLVYDITGKLVMSPIQNQSLLVGKNKFTINTSDLNNGIYFVTLITNKGKETVKLIVNK
jgi:signal transduction histidine kinase